MDTYDEMTGILIDGDINKISEDGAMAVKQVKKLIEDEYPEFRIAGPNGDHFGVKYWSIKKGRRNVLILEEHESKNYVEKGLLTNLIIKKEDINRLRYYDKLNWKDVFYGNRRKYDTKGKTVDQIRSIFNYFKYHQN